MKKTASKIHLIFDFICTCTYLALGIYNFSYSIIQLLIFPHRISLLKIDFWFRIYSACVLQSPWKNLIVFVVLMTFFFFIKARPRTTDIQWRHKSKKSENLGRYGRQNMLRLYLKIWEWELIFGRAVKAISSPGVRSLWHYLWQKINDLHLVSNYFNACLPSALKYEFMIYGLECQIKGWHRVTQNFEATIALENSAVCVK